MLGVVEKIKEDVVCVIFSHLFVCLCGEVKICFIKNQNLRKGE